MKTVLRVLLFVVVVGLPVSSVYARTGSMMEGFSGETTVSSEVSEHTDSIESVLEGILSGQNVSTVQELDMSDITDEEWERLGDAVMELNHPGEAHEAMDRMMGGEGSEQLRQMHIAMGKAYLGYKKDWYGMMSSGSGGMMGMMGAGMMGYGAGGVNGLLGGVVWVAIIVFLASGAYYFIKQAGKK